MNHHNAITMNWAGHKVRSKLLISQQHTIRSTDIIQFADIPLLERKLKGSRMMLKDNGYRAGGCCYHYFSDYIEIARFFCHNINDTVRFYDNDGNSVGITSTKDKKLLNTLIKDLDLDILRFHDTFCLYLMYLLPSTTSSLSSTKSSNNIRKCDCFGTFFLYSSINNDTESSVINVLPVAFSS